MQYFYYFCSDILSLHVLQTSEDLGCRKVENSGALITSDYSKWPHIAIYKNIFLLPTEVGSADILIQTS